MEILLLSTSLVFTVAGIIYSWRKNSVLQTAVNQLRTELATQGSGKEEIRLNEARLNAMLEAATDKMIRLGQDGTILEVFTRSGFHSSTPERSSVGKRVDSVYDETIAPRYQHAVEQALLTGRMQSFIYDGERCGRPYGREVRLICCGEEIIVAERDITERIAIAKQLHYLSSYDPLTGLLNYQRFEQELKRIRENADSPVGVLVCELGGIRLINATLGRAAGDRLLIAAADILKRCFRHQDCIARIGSDEFAVLLPGLTADEVGNLHKELEDEAKEYNAMLPNSRLTLAVGSASGSSGNVDSTFITANEAMYQQKLLRGESVRQYILDGIFHSAAMRDHIDISHPERIERYVTNMADALGLDQHTTDRMRLLARYHDIGAAGLDERIVLKPGRLTDTEREEIARHSEIGSRIACCVPDLAPIADLILKHHEQWDGNGYPLGLRNTEIPIECRIFAIADAYEVMTAGRPYASARDQANAMEELRRGAGRQFDPQLVDRFIAILEKCV